MNYRLIATSSFLAFGFLLAGCEESDQKDLLTKVKGMTSPNEITAAIGPADEITRDGALIQWRYETSEKDVCFMVAGNIALRMICNSDE